VDDIVSRFWQKCLEGNLFAGRDGQFRVDRLGVDRLKDNSNALALWITLQNIHGHRPAIRFPLSHPDRRDTGLADLSRERFRRAVAFLLNASFLGVARNHISGVAPRLCRLKRARPFGATLTVEILGANLGS
jgi:hypothetical protein